MKPGGFGAKKGVSLSALKAQTKTTELEKAAKEKTQEKPRQVHTDVNPGSRDFFGTGKADPKDEQAAPVLEVGTGAYQVSGARAGLSIFEQRVKAITGTLNKMAPEKYETLCSRLVGEHDVLSDDDILKRTVQLIFSRAVSQNDLCALFADLCNLFAKKLQDQPERAKEFRKMLLNAVQNEYEIMKGKSASEMPKQKRLGVAQFVGELYNKSLLNLRVMQFILGELLYGTWPPAEDAALHHPSELDLEVLCKLLATTGSHIDKDPSGNAFVTDYLETMQKLAKVSKYPQRTRFMVLDTTELRVREWVCASTEYYVLETKRPYSLTQTRKQKHLVTRRSWISRRKRISM